MYWVSQYIYQANQIKTKLCISEYNCIILLLFISYFCIPFISPDPNIIYFLPYLSDICPFIWIEYFVTPISYKSHISQHTPVVWNFIMFAFIVRSFFSEVYFICLPWCMIPCASHGRWLNIPCLSLQTQSWLPPFRGYVHNKHSEPSEERSM